MIPRPLEDVLVNEIEQRALHEIAEEDKREAVDRAKERIRKRKSRSLWQKIFPWTISIKRRT